MGIQVWNDNRTYRIRQDYVKVRLESLLPSSLRDL